MNSNPGLAEQRIKDAISAWRNLRPTKKFLGLTVDAFEAELKPCFDLRTEIENLETKLTGLRNSRDTVDATGLSLVDRFVSAIKADESEGEDSQLPEVMGYVIKSKRKSGLHRTTPDSTTTPLTKAA